MIISEMYNMCVDTDVLDDIVDSLDDIIDNMESLQ